MEYKKTEFFCITQKKLLTSENLHGMDVLERSYYELVIDVVLSRITSESLLDLVHEVVCDEQPMRLRSDLGQIKTIEDLLWERDSYHFELPVPSIILHKFLSEEKYKSYIEIYGEDSEEEEDTESDTDKTAPMYDSGEEDEGRVLAGGISGESSEEI